jgi:hypothetical protein
MRALRPLSVSTTPEVETWKSARVDAVGGEQAEHRGVDPGGAERLHEVEGEGWAPGEHGVEEAEHGVEADPGEGGAGVAHEQGVAEADEGVDAIAGRTAASPRKSRRARGQGGSRARR